MVLVPFTAVLPFRTQAALTTSEVLVESETLKDTEMSSCELHEAVTFETTGGRLMKWMEKDDVPLARTDDRVLISARLVDSNCIQRYLPTRRRSRNPERRSSGMLVFPSSGRLS